ncbi:transposase [Gordonia sp. (in: high G+C Gram-positive bacteria)]|uniref:IS256 family transposase n=1 Tax=Gordonia sp. (in: high G+C Gram-positive bacteria) TaxID=84139 RepID=UPI00352820E7
MTSGTRPATRRRRRFNSRNGYGTKTVATEVGDVELRIPRDRDGSFIPMLVRKGQRRLDGLDAMIVSLYAGGMTIRDIQHHLASTIGTDLSHETISKITEEVADEVIKWQQPPTAVPGDVPRRDRGQGPCTAGHVINKSAHLAVGVDVDGIKHVLGIWIAQTEGAKFWASVCAELRNRGVQDVLIVCCDGLTGFAGRGRGDLAAGYRADVRGPPDPGVDAVRVLR